MWAPKSSQAARRAAKAEAKEKGKGRDSAGWSDTSPSPRDRRTAAPATPTPVVLCEVVPNLSALRRKDQEVRMTFPDVKVDDAGRRGRGVFAEEDIKRGEQLFNSYGTSYWLMQSS